MSVTTEEPASDKLLKASAVMAMEPETVPATSLPRNSRILIQADAGQPAERAILLAHRGVLHIVFITDK